MLEELKAAVCSANKQLKELGLVILTWGNVSARDFQTNYVVIKPSGIPYETMTPNDMVVTDKEGNVIEGNLRPSSDLRTHLALYNAYPTIGSIVHTHSRWATIWAQMGESIPPYGTTHADDFFGFIRCTRDLTPDEIKANYEENTGKVIVECIGEDLAKQYGVLVKNHGPFVWEGDPEKAVEKALVLEEVSMMAWYTRMASAQYSAIITDELMRKHFDRKHGKNAYYGQKK